MYLPLFFYVSFPPSKYITPSLQPSQRSALSPCLASRALTSSSSPRAHPAPSFLLTHCLILPPAPVNLFLFSLLPAHRPLQPQLCFLPPMQIPPSGFPPNFYPSPSVFLHSYSSLNPVTSSLPPAHTVLQFLLQLHTSLPLVSTILILSNQS